MRFVPNILLILSLPAGMAGYWVGVQVVSAVMPDLALGIVMLFVPLLVAGLFMLPFLVPFIDRKAKRDLAAYRAGRGTDEDDVNSSDEQQ
jgi:apolipoprotein N-acyltransferase